MKNKSLVFIDKNGNLITVTKKRNRFIINWGGISHSVETLSFLETVAAGYYTLLGNL